MTLFLTDDLFSAANPLLGADPNIPVKKVLGVAAADLDHRFPLASPERGAIEAAIGGAYAGLADTYDLLREYSAANRRYDTIVLDPPAFAKTKRDLDKALRGYKELNLRAMKMLRPGGILVTCSCSFHVGAADFLGVVADAARDAHKDLRLIESRGASKDHPILLNVPETSYLQCLILSVSN